MDALLTRQEVAKRLQVSPDTVTDMADTGELAAHDVGRGGRRRLRIEPAAVDAYLERCKVAGRTRGFALPPRTDRPVNPTNTDPWEH